MNLISSAKAFVNNFGYEIRITKRTNKNASFPLQFSGDLTDVNRNIVELCSSYTMTSVERQVALLNAVEYVSRNNIGGSFVECGVWKGGSSLAAALKFSDLGDIREIYMFDTFEGMTSPTEADVDLNGVKADVLLNLEVKNIDSKIWCIAGYDSVKETMRLAEEYPQNKIKLIKGKVEDTLKENLPSSISILRLDTDWYESTKYEMEYLFPKLSVGGVLIIDDYGHWAGARKAIKEYLRENKIKIFLQRIDYTGRIGIKVSFPE